jgi:hypothetical protein
LASSARDTPGQSNARNIGTWIVAGPLVAFIDEDAIAAPD